MNNYSIGYIIGNGQSVTFNASQNELVEWNNLVAIYSGDSLKLYLNNVLKGTLAYSGGTNAIDDNLRIGSWDNPSLPQNTLRQLDDIAIYNRALSQEEITALYTGEPVIPATVCNPLPSNLQNGLVGYWPFCGNTNDESGNGNDGTVNGATLTEDRFGVANAAYDFDGVDDWIEVLDNESIRLSSGTVSAWVNYESSAKMVLLIKQDRENPFLNTSNYGIELNDYGGTLSGPRILGMYTEDCSSNQVSWNSLNSNINLSDGLWHQVTSVYDSSSISLFIDGEFIGTENSDVNFMGACPETELMFGRGWNDFPFWYNGAIDDIAIYNRALSQEEITALYTGEPVNPPTACNPLPSNLQNGLVGYWPFCGNANDESGNGNDGTVNGATLTEDRFGLEGSAYQFYTDNSGGNISLNGFALTDSFTISSWINLQNYNDYNVSNIISRYSSNGYELNIANQSNGIYGLLGSDSDPNNSVISNTGISLNQWNHVSWMKNGPNSKIYYNGNLVFETNTANPVTTGSGDITFGLSQWGGNPFKGSIDDIGIWNRALSAEEVQQLYTLNACTFSIYDTTYVTIYDTVSISTTDTLIINTLITGVRPAQENTFLVYPNPAGSQITINNGNVNILGGYTMRISNSIGQEVYNENITQTEVTLDLSNWGGNGLYVLYILDPQGEIIAVKQIVLQ